MSDDIVSLNFLFVILPLCIRKRSPCQFALANNYICMIKLFSHELFTVFKSHYPIIRFSKEIFLLLLARAVFFGLAVALVER